MKTRSHIRSILILLFILAGLAARPVLAQDNEFTITMRRDFGYSSGTGDIQGRFSLRATEGEDDLTSVTYLLDGEPMGMVSEPPFHLEFNTDSYTPGRHTITATGLTAAGEERNANTISRNFISSDAARSTTIQLVVYIIGGLVLVLGVVFIIITLVTRNAESVPMGAPRTYGHTGGAICPKCQRPYSMHIYGFNLLTHRFDHCPHCGKWSLVRRASPQELEAARLAELSESADKPAIPEMDPAEKRRRDLDDSRYQDL